MATTKTIKLLLKKYIRKIKYKDKRENNIIKEVRTVVLKVSAGLKNKDKKFEIIGNKLYCLNDTNVYA